MFPITALMLSRQAEEERRLVLSQRRSWLEPVPMETSPRRISLVEIFSLSRFAQAPSRS